MDCMTLLEGWATGRGAAAQSPHSRIDSLLRRITPGAVLDADTLGMRNQRVLALHGALGEGALEAVAPCPHCDVVNEFALPVEGVLALPAPDAHRRVEVGGQGFRLPLMAELLRGDDTPIAELCREPGTATGPLSPELVARAGAMLDALDPAANVVIDLTCSGCAALYRASVDIAGFVAAALDRAAARIFHEIDTIAHSYGWSEAAIAALPAARRRRYVAMIGQRAAAPARMRVR